MTLNAATVEEIFRDIGLSVRVARLYGSDVPALIAAESVKRRTQLASGDERLAHLGVSVASDNQNIEQIAGLADGEARLVESYILDYVKSETKAKGASAEEILTDLADRMIEECTPHQYVLRNEVALAGSVVADSGNAGNGTLGSVVLSQYIACQRFTVECIDASVVGSEVWSVTGSVLGELESATTGVAYADSNVFLQFTITAGGSAFAAGDKFYFYTSCTERRFQTFFRDKFGVVMPSAAAGSQTIDEAWAT